jgi:BirA family transcriptional regulator, biotin operon repressor / biotin---[acetyl-CoA-carboxylase] ligase
MSLCGASPAYNWPFVRTLLRFEEIDSTSDCAARWIRDENVELPMAVWAKHQTRGRGRGSHSWWSDTGSLTVTLAIDPKAHGLAVESEPRLALATAVAVIDALDELGFGSPSVGIRWPNDLEAGGRKLGGILPERVETENGHRNLIGVGLNVLTQLDRSPTDIRAMATSLAAISNRALDVTILPPVLSAILRHFERVLTRLVNDDPLLSSRWNQLDLLRDRWVSVDLGARIVAGRGCGINPAGALCLDDGREELRLFGGQVLRS